MQKIEYDIPIFNNEDVADLNKYSTLMANAIKGQIDKFGNPLIFKGTVQTLADLQALTNIKSGYIYRVDDENKNYIYNGTDWVIYSDNVDLSAYQEEVNEQLTNIEQEGIIVSSTEPAKNRRKVWMQKGKNLFDKSKVTKGYFLHKDTGIATISEGYSYSDYIYVKNFDKIAISAEIYPSAQNPRFYFLR